MRDQVQIARTTLGEIRAVLAEMEVPDVELQRFAEASVDGPNDAVIEMRITGQMVTYALVEETE